jgi:hypothetical protein
MERVEFANTWIEFEWELFLRRRLTIHYMCWASAALTLQINSSELGLIDSDILFVYVKQNTATVEDVEGKWRFKTATTILLHQSTTVSAAVVTSLPTTQRIFIRIGCDIVTSSTALQTGSSTRSASTWVSYQSWDFWETPVWLLPSWGELPRY